MFFSLYNSSRQVNESYGVALSAPSFPANILPGGIPFAPTGDMSLGSPMHVHGQCYQTNRGQSAGVRGMYFVAGAHQACGGDQAFFRQQVYSGASYFAPQTMVPGFPIGPVPDQPFQGYNPMAGPSTTYVPMLAWIPVPEPRSLMTTAAGPVPINWSNRYPTGAMPPISTAPITTTSESRSLMTTAA